MGVLLNKAYDIILNPFDAFIAGNTVATTQKQKRVIPADRNYQFFIMELINCVPADFAYLQLTANNLPIQTWMNGKDLDIANQDQGLPSAASSTGNPLLIMSTRRDRLFGGALQSIQNGQLYSGAPKDLETNTSLNCGSQDANGFQISTCSLELWLNAENNANKPVVNLYAYGYDPFPGGPGSIKFVDQKLVNIPAGYYTLDKDTAFTLGDGQRNFMDQVLLMNPNNRTIDNITVNWQSLPVRNRLSSVNTFIQAFNTLNQTIAGLFRLYDSREMLYGDEALPIGLLNSAFTIKANYTTAEGMQLYQVSQGSLAPIPATTLPVGQA